MDYISISRRRKTVILIIAIVVHLFFLLLIFAALMSDEQSWLNPRHLFEQAQILPQSPQTSPEASVIFHDDPVGTRGEPSVAEEAAEDKAQPIAEAQQMDQSVKQESPPLEKPATPIVAEVAAAQPEPQELIQKILSQAQKAEAAENSTNRPEQPEAPMAPTRPRSRPQSAGTSSGLTLGDITRGFLKSVQQEHGRSPQATDSENIARQRYSTRVWSILKQSYRAHRSPTYLLSDLSTQATLTIQLNKEGQLLQIKLEHPNKTHDLYEVEQIIINAAKKAGLYPPIPPTFNANTITLSYPLMISVKEGVHVYDFVYQ